VVTNADGSPVPVVTNADGSPVPVATNPDGSPAPTPTVAGGAPAPTPTVAGGAPAPTSTLTIENTTFSAASGFTQQAFSIVNNDAVAHTVTDSGKAFDLEIPALGTASLTLTQPGTYQIHCRIHSSMQGTIVVA
jgi:hypothetical protein